MKEKGETLEEIKMIAEVTKMWNPDISRMIGWVDERSKHFHLVHNTGDMWRVTADNHETMVFPELFDALVQVAIRITGYVGVLPDTGAVAFNALDDRDKWTEFREKYKEDDKIEWLCMHCGHVDEDKPQRSQPFHGCSIVCDWCGGELSRRTGGGQGDPFNWVMRVKT